jgi:hypothetical protein
MNEVAQWMLLFVVGMLLLGVLRQLALMLPAEARTPSRELQTGELLPGKLRRRVHELPLVVGGYLVAFVSESCRSCERLLSQLESLPREERPPLILVARGGSPVFVDALRKAGDLVVEDDGAIWSEVGVAATPTVLHVDSSGRIVRREVTHHVVLEHLRPPSEAARRAVTTE